MKRTGLALILLLALFSVLLGVQVVKVAKAVLPLSSGIKITSPANVTYSPSLLTLSVRTSGIIGGINYSMAYSLDGKDNVTIPLESHQSNPNNPITGITAGAITLPKLSEGSHIVKVYGECDVYNFGVNGVFYPKYVDFDYNEVYFTVDDGNPPIISNVSFENKTYTQNELSLNFTIDEPTSWIGYCLDGKANVTISGNITLNGLSDGSHSVVIYANDTVGNVGASEMVTLSIDTPEPFPITQVAAAASGASVAIISVGLLVYFKKRKR